MIRTYAPDGKVLTDFFWDRSRLGVIQGPIQSGTSSACCHRLWVQAEEQLPDDDGVRRTRWIVTRDCFDDQTEILTDEGWRLFRDLEPHQKVAQLRDGKTEFVAPLGYHAAPYSGEMMGYQAEGVDFLVTPDHKMHVSRSVGRARVWGDFELRKCHEIFGNESYRVQRDAGWDGVDPGRPEAFFEWLGFWFAEGHAAIYKGRHVCVITQKNGLDYVRGLFAAADLPFSENQRSDDAKNFKLRITPETRMLVLELATLGKASTKAIPSWVRNAPPGHLKAFIKGYLAGDGLHNGLDIATTSSRQLADDLQEMALRAGYVANITTHDATGQERIINGVKTAARGPTWFITFVSDKKYRPQLRKQRSEAARYRGWYRKSYDGWVFCVEVPTHVIYVRRNGKAFWCSQTYKDLRETTIKTWLHWFPEAIWGPFIRAEPGYHSLKRPHSSGDGTTVDCEVIFLALPDPDVAEKVLASYEITGFFRNEAQFAEKRVIDELLSRCARYPSKSFGPGATWYGGFLDLNAPIEGHWIPYMRGDIPIPADWTDEQKIAMEKPDGWKFFVQPPGLIEEMRDGRVAYRENPGAENQKWTTQPYLELIRGKDKDWIDQRVMNRIGVYQNGKPVYPQFFASDHVASVDADPIEGAPIIVGLDFGREPAAAFCQCVNGQWRPLSELIGSNESAAIFAPRVKRHLAQKYPGFKAEFWGDPRGADRGQTDERTAYDIFEANGMKVLPATTDNNVEMRRSAMSAVLMRRGALKVNPSCTTLKVGMGGGYHFPKIRGTGQFSERPRKNLYSHICEAFENAILGGGEGDAVVTSSQRVKLTASPVRRHKVSLRR